MDVGGNIRRIRVANNMTQDDVVGKMQLMGLSISRSSYAKIEACLMNVKVSELVALKNIFNCSFEDFFIGIDLPVAE